MYNEYYVEGQLTKLKFVAMTSASSSMENSNTSA